MSTPRALLYGTLVVGILDLADALVFFGLRGARPIRILQSIASGLLRFPAVWALPFSVPCCPVGGVAGTNTAH